MGRNTRWLILIPAVIFALAAKPTKADILGNWTYSQSGTTGSVEVINNDIILHGPDNECCSANWVQIETVIPTDITTIDFTWTYQTNDGAYYDPPQYGVNGVYTTLTQLSSDTGSLSVPVVAGDVFAFRQYSIDTCCQPGNLTISNLSLWVSTTSSTTTTTTSTTTVQETTTSSAPQTTSTVLAPTTTQPLETLPPSPPEISVPVSVETSVPTTLPETTTSTSTTTTTAATTTVPPPSNTSTSTSTSLPPATTIAPESPQTTLPAVLSDLTPTEALSVALASETLTTLTATQAEQVFANIQTEQLSDTEIAAITEAVQDAPTEVREAFEQEVDVFKAGFDDYVPLGSNIPVGTRRTLIAITAGITLAVAGSRIKR